MVRRVHRRQAVEVEDRYDDIGKTIWAVKCTRQQNASFDKLKACPYFKYATRVYRRLAEQAERERRSVAQQALTVLARGLDVEIDAKARRRNVLRAIRESGAVKGGRFPNPATLIRKDRRR